jgi:hypothetical protein
LPFVIFHISFLSWSFLLNFIVHKATHPTRGVLVLQLHSYYNVFSQFSSTILSFKIREGVFTNVEYAGKFLAAAVAKRPGWLDRVKIKDIYGKN